MKPVLLAFLVPGTALAHQGDHATVSADHMLTEPDHAFMLLAAAVLVAAIWLIRRAR